MQFNSSKKSLKGSYWNSFIAYIVTSFKKNDKARYRAIISGLLPEAVEQHKIDKKAVGSLLSNWHRASYNPEIDNISNGEIKDISGLLDQAIKLANWGWLIALSSGFVLLISGVSATRYVQKLVEPKADEDCTVHLGCVPLLSSAGIVDIDSDDFDEGQLSVGFVDDTRTENDFLGIRSQPNNPNEIVLKGNTVIYRSVEIGGFEIDEESGKLLVLFNDQVNQEAASALLRNISYWNTSEEPQLGDKKVEFQVSDGDGEFSETLTRTISVVADSSPPTIQAPSNMTVKGDSDLFISDVSVQDPDSPDITVILSVSNGVLTVQENLEQGLDSEGIKNNASSSVILDGTVDQINLTLSGKNALKYRSNTNFSGEDVLVITATESGTTAPERDEERVFWPATASLIKENMQEVAITVNPASSPIISMSTVENLAVDEDKVLTLGNIEVVDPDSQSVGVGFQVESGSVSITESLPEGLSEETRFVDGFETLVISGNIQQLNSFLSKPDALTYQSYQDFYGSDYINLIVCDGSYCGNFGTEITVRPINDPPVISANLPIPDTDFSDASSPPAFQETPAREDIDITNATVIGTTDEKKNVRAGIYTDQEVLFELPVGSRVQILDRRYNSDNFPWYQIYSPDLNRDGWIAGHLIRED